MHGVHAIIEAAVVHSVHGWKVGVGGWLVVIESLTVDVRKLVLALDAERVEIARLDILAQLVVECGHAVGLLRGESGTIILLVKECKRGLVFRTAKH